MASTVRGRSRHLLFHLCYLAATAAVVAHGSNNDDCIISGTNRLCFSASSNTATLQVGDSQPIPLVLASSIGPNCTSPKREQYTITRLCTTGPGISISVTDRFDGLNDTAGAIRWTTEYWSNSVDVVGTDGPDDGFISSYQLSECQAGPGKSYGFWSPLATFPPLSVRGYDAAVPFRAMDLVLGNEVSQADLDKPSKPHHSPPKFTATTSESENVAGESYMTAWLMLTTTTNTDGDTAFTVVSDLEEPIINGRIRIGASASSCNVSFARYRQRLSPAGSVVTTRYVLGHASLWRPVVKWMQAKYEPFFEPNYDVVKELWGAAQYHDYRSNSYNFSLWQELGFKFYWDATFPFGWWGDYLPSERNFSLCVPVGHANNPAPWVPYPVPRHPNSDYKCDQLSWDVVRSWYEDAESHGFRALYYQNPFEFGFDIREVNATLDCSPMPPAGSSIHAASCESNLAFRSGIHRGVLRDSAGKMINATCCGIAPTMVLIDPLEPSFADWLVEDLRRQVSFTPAAGTCLDRTDHAAQFRRGGDDGISYWSAAGGITSSLSTGWKQVVARMQEVLRDHHQALFMSSTHNVRLDLMKGIDGLYDEFGDAPAGMFALGWMAMKRPIAMWSHNYLGNYTNTKVAAWPGHVGTNWDAFFQMHLQVGAYPTIPSPWGDHTNVPNPETDQLFVDYAPLWRRLHGKEWVVSVPQPARSEDDTVWTNMFNTSNGMLLMVSFQGFFSREPSATCQLGTVQNNTNADGGDLYNIQLNKTAKSDECIARCCLEPMCYAFVYRQDGYGRNGNCDDRTGACCWLKSTAQPTEPDPGTIFGTINATLPLPPKQTTVYVDASLFASAPTSATVMHPGGNETAIHIPKPSQGRLLLKVPLQRGGAIVYFPQD